MTGRTAPLELYDHWAPHYDDLLGKAGLSHVWPAFRRACRRFNIRLGTVADFGCGTGLFLDALSRIAPATALFGIDRSAGMLRVAARRLQGKPVRLVHGDLRFVQLPVLADLATCNFSTLNYLRKPSDLSAGFLNISRYMKPGSHLVIDFLFDSGSETDHIYIQNIRLPLLTADWQLRRDGQNARGQVIMRNCSRTADAWTCWQETHEQRWWPLDVVVRHLETSRLVPCSIMPLGGVSPSRGGRWVQIVARRR